QADLLSRLKSIKPAELEAALEHLQPDTPQSPTVGHSALACPAPQDPRGFLQAVMNDPAVPLALRIEAAKALLPGSQTR
ncbi:MAG: hypothetical protein ACK4NM_14855, partial [Hydrogenophaga sp.]